jgi:hypothetical protein
VMPNVRLSQTRGFLLAGKTQESSQITISKADVCGF